MRRQRFDIVFLISCGILMPMLIALGALAGFGEAMASFSPSPEKSADGAPAIIGWLYKYPLPAKGVIVYVINGICWALGLSFLIAVVVCRSWQKRKDA